MKEQKRASKPGESLNTIRHYLKFLCLVCATVICMLVLACGGDKADQANAENKSEIAPDSTQKIKQLVFTTTDDPRDLNPVLATDLYDGMVNSLIFDTLVVFEEGDTTRIKPWLAESWDISDDGLEYTFHLRPNARFSNGQPVTAQEVKACFERLLRAGEISPRANFFFAIKGAKEFNTVSDDTPETLEGVQVLDDHTVRFILEAPSIPFIQILAMPNAAIYPNAEFDRMGGQEFGKNPIGSGPWIIKSWDVDQEIVFTPNENFWGEKPKIDEFVFKIRQNTQASVSEFEVGVVDLLSLPENLVSDFQANPKYKDLIVENKQLNIYYCGINTSKAPTNDLRIRQAICYSVNADAILEFVNLGQGIRAHGPVPPGLDGYRADIEPWPYDPDKARAILADIGYPEKPLQIWTTQGELFTTVAEAIKADLEKVGFKITLVQNDFSSFKQGVFNGAPDMYVTNWWADYPDIENFIQPIYHTASIKGGANGTHYSNPEVDALIDEAEHMVNSQERIKKFQQVEDIIRADCTHIFLWHSTTYEIHQERVKNYKPAVIYNSRKYLDIDLDVP